MDFPNSTKIITRSLSTSFRTKNSASKLTQKGPTCARFWAFGSHFFDSFGPLEIDFEPLKVDFNPL